MSEQVVYLKINIEKHTDPSQTGGCLNQSFGDVKVDITNKIRQIVMQRLKKYKEFHNLNDGIHETSVVSWEIKTIE